ncbi:MAG: tetratricopeptide repeat protein [Bacteroidota bacterium]
MTIKQNKKTRTLIVMMTVLVFAGVGIAMVHYKGVNRFVDPRIKEARLLYEKYNEFASSNQHDSIFWLMDTIESIYHSFDHYKESYETAVLYNNRAAVHLSVYLQPENEILIRDTAKLMSKAENAVKYSIRIIRDWINRFEGLDEDEIRKAIEKDFLIGMDHYSSEEKEKFLEKRVEEIIEAQIENKRRLSVSYTNLGIIKRHQERYDSAAIYYKKAIDLWDRNLSAENNLNILLNRPLKKPNLIQKLFPPEK